jgi:uncharacterized protein
MTDYIPLFPLKLVVFPGEYLNLHIFEPRYRQLINDVKDNKKVFGIGVFIDKLMAFGSEVELIEIAKVYDDGRMDIKTQGKRVFEILSFDNPMDKKLYAGGNVLFYDNDPRVSEAQFKEFTFYLKELFRLMNHNVKLNQMVFNSFTYAHKIGLKIEEEYDLLLMEKESDRISYLIKHLMKIIPVMREIELAKKRIQMNGHFKNLDPLNF